MGEAEGEAVKNVGLRAYMRRGLFRLRYPIANDEVPSFMFIYFISGVLSVMLCVMYSRYASDVSEYTFV
jgi:hypothetical protein